jgi:hypothetical protein
MAQPDLLNHAQAAATSRRKFAGDAMGDGAPSFVERLKNRHVFQVAARGVRNRS